MGRCLTPLLLFLVVGPAAAIPEVKIVAIGDSTVAGAPGFQSPLEAPPDGAGDPRSQLTYWIRQRHPEWRVLNRGVSGATVLDIVDRVERDAIGEWPQAIIILVGINDLHRGDPPDLIQWQLAQLYEQVSQRGIPVVACTILPVDRLTDTARANLQTVNAWIRSYAAGAGLEVCDTYQAVEHPQESGYLLGTTDGLHPDIEGYRRVGEALVEVLERML